MLIKGYTSEFVRPPNPTAEHLRCYAQLQGDIGEVLPYLNTRLKGHLFLKDPPSLTLKLPGKLVTLTPDTISINIVKDQAEAEDILKWLMGEINETWEVRADIEPSYEVPEKVRVLDILRLLPKTNCKKCGEPTCMVFAVKVSEGTAAWEDCPEVDVDGAKDLAGLLGGAGAAQQAG